MDIERKIKIIYVRDLLKFQAFLSKKDIPAGAKLVMDNLLYRAGGKDYAFPSQEKIGVDIGLSARQVRNHLTLLHKRGYITWTRKAYNPKIKTYVNSNKYDLSSILKPKIIKQP